MREIDSSERRARTWNHVRERLVFVLVLVGLALASVAQFAEVAK